MFTFLVYRTEVNGRQTFTFLVYRAEVNVRIPKYEESITCIFDNKARTDFEGLRGRGRRVALRPI